MKTNTNDKRPNAVAVAIALAASVLLSAGCGATTTRDASVGGKSARHASPEEVESPIEVEYVSLNQADGAWGNLKGQFIYNGKAPTPEKLNLTKDQDVCGKPPTLVDESLVVGPDGGLANVLVWVRTRDVKSHPDYEKTATDKALIDNKHCRFDPHVVTLRVGQPLEVKNSDPPPVAHNTSALLMNNIPFNFQIPAEQSQDMKPLPKAELGPVQISCTIHPWMRGWLLVQPHPYMAVSDEKGNFELKNLPVGTELEFQVWQEKAGNIEKATVGGKDPGWRRGRFKMTIKPGDNDLGQIKLDPTQFNK